MSIFPIFVRLNEWHGTEIVISFVLGASQNVSVGKWYGEKQEGLNAPLC